MKHTEHYNYDHSVVMHVKFREGVISFKAIALCLP